MTEIVNGRRQLKNPPEFLEMCKRIEVSALKRIEEEKIKLAQWRKLQRFKDYASRKKLHLATS